MKFSYCPNCKRNTETMSDYAVGDTICCECGLVLESSIFVNEDCKRNTKTLSDYAFGDTICCGCGFIHKSSMVVDEDHQGSNRNKEREIISGYDKGKNRGEQLYTGVSLSFCELNIDDTATSSHAAGDDIVRGICSRLGMNSEAISVVQEAVSISKELGLDQGNSRPVLAAIVYMISQISDYETSLRDMSVAAEVGEETIKKTYKAVYPFASIVLPNWHANEEQKCRMQFANLEIAQSQRYDKHHTANNMME